MIPEGAAAIKLPRFVTIWIFARMIHYGVKYKEVFGFVTIWIFARMIRFGNVEVGRLGFVTIWIFARMIQIRCFFL